MRNIIKSFKNRTIDYDKAVKVYRNLNNGLLSIVQNQVVVAHAEGVNLKEVTFRVQKAGQKKCRKNGVKTVHAYASGFLIKGLAFSRPSRKISYNPYKHDTFVDEKKSPIRNVNDLLILSDGSMLY